MKMIDVSQAKAPLADYAHQATEEALVLTENGVPFAAIMSIEPEDLESIQLSENPKFMELIENAREEVRQGKTVSLEEILAEFKSD